MSGLFVLARKASDMEFATNPGEDFVFRVVCSTIVIRMLKYTQKKHKIDWAILTKFLYIVY